MRPAIATVCLSGTLEEKLAAIAAAGFSDVEIFENDLLSFAGPARDAGQIARDLGLRIACYQPFRDFEGMPEPQRSKVFARAERKFDTMAELGCDLLMICSNVSPDSLGGLDRAADDLRELGERAERRGLRVAFEALSWGRHVNDYRDAWEIVRRADQPAIGFVLDSFHILAKGTDLRPIRSIPPEKIFLVQLADAPKLDMDLLSWSRHYRCFPGQGELPLDPFMDALAATGFEGLLSLEIFNDRFRAASARRVAVDGRRSLLVLLDDLAGRSADPERSRLPPRSPCRGVAFIEIALSESAEPPFAAVLEGLGFTRAGRHRSKAVELWRQGGIDLVINKETEGFAHSYNVVHGSSVCALALSVEDAGASAARASALLEQPFHQPARQGELDIPAVRGVAGSLLYLVDDGPLGRWREVDFSLAATPATVGTGLVGVDHVSQTMPHEEMLSWQLFYQSLVELKRLPAQTVLDPGGIVQSQPLQTADGSLRVVLNTSQSTHTLSARFLSESFGGSVQHIALSTDDIFRTARQLADNGVPVLPIPESYYEDLDSRVDLPPERIALMRELNILYDRDDRGEFFQLYTRSLLEGGFFFEIVQRSGYAGFGAVNAPIRLAAQTRLARDPAVPRA